MFELLLFIAGDSNLSRRAVSNLERLCEDSLGEQCAVEVIDILKNPALARQHRVIATPMAVRVTPLPQRKVIGDLSDAARFFEGLGIPRRGVE
ncbi:circadian clock KaiB family protein [Stratiformator vulcanicus]|uniref:Circadian clock protein KaiB n=1 Tax=Stratiformator vulcanicus TaxID=2527980 RepID=A0A517R0M2_9PLAN|nr:circadian clock KaiB family protein [Stratiformator vulcanicus]QDT37418.1 Circadian clock protein KaiB [Stratiformator vulcanicus]